MKAPQLETSNPHIYLVEPNVDRDAPLSVQWLDGEAGRDTLSRMGVADKDNQPTTLEYERKRIQGFIENADELNWMIELNGTIVGTIWVNLTPTNALPAPAVHIMIGDPAARGQGVGGAAMRAVIRHLIQQGEEVMHSRRLVHNTAAAVLLEDAGFQSAGKPYTDVNGLKWQNVIRK